MDTKSSRTRKIAQKPIVKDEGKDKYKVKGKDKDTATPEPEPPQAIEIDIDGKSVSLVDVRATGDILLDVTFENRHAKRTILSLGTALQPRYSGFSKTKTPDERVLYRVRLDTLKKTSKYFERLLTDERFQEAKKIASSFASLRALGIDPSEAEPTALPRISITEDDDATHIAGRAPILADLLRILHGGDAASKLSIPYLAILAVMADRFDCAAVVGRYVRGTRRIPWPQTVGQTSWASEEVLRQKILVAWLLEDKLRFAAATREIVFRGSVRWTGREETEKEMVGVWWDLPDGLEAELLCRRSCILRTLASLQSHFIGLYTSRDRQCKMFYDSSAACDSFQLGEMIKFFANKGLFTFTSPLSVNEEDYPEPYEGDIENLITALRQCPSWQYDKHHAHCGLRTRLIPALDFVQAMLGFGIGIDRGHWKVDRPHASWGKIKDREPFRLTRAVTSDPRLKMEGLLTSNPLSKDFFTAGRWDWTPED